MAEKLTRPITLPEQIRERLREGELAAYRAELPYYTAFLDEYRACTICNEKGIQRETRSWRGSLVMLKDKMCEEHFAAYEHYRKTGHAIAPTGPYDFI